jgi:hypothetical protein
MTQIPFKPFQPPPNFGRLGLEERLRILEKRLTSLEYALGRFQAGTSSQTTNASGVATVTFAVPYTQAPQVVIQCRGTIAVANGCTPSTTGFVFNARNAAGALLTSTSINFDWMAYLPVT